VRHPLVLVLAIASVTLPTSAATAQTAIGVKLQMREGRPVVDDVMVDGHGPYRFMVDTGATWNSIDPKLAQAIGMTATFQTQLTSSTGITQASGHKGSEVRLGPVAATDQIFLFAGMEAVHKLSADIQGVLGQVFLAHFDYLLDARAGRMDFGRYAPTAHSVRVAFEVVQGRPVIETSLGSLALDSGAHLLVRFGVKGTGAQLQMATMSGTTQVSLIDSTLVIDGRTVWRGEAIAVPHSPEAGEAGLLPTSLFKIVYVCNSAHYLILE